MNLTDKSRSGDDSVKQVALEWLMRGSPDELTADERQRFEVWCGSDPRHMAAYHRLAGIWRDASQLTDLRPLISGLQSNDSDHRRTGARFSRLARPLQWTAAAICVLVMGVTGFYFANAGRETTGLGEVREIQLSDGTRVTLGARTSLRVKYSAAERLIALEDGEAYFAVATDPNRPFVVSLGGKRVTVTGTEFNIRRSAASVRVSVVAGTVHVRNESDAGAAVQAGESPTERVLHAGEELEAALAGPLGAVRTAPVLKRASWRMGRLTYVDARLAEVVADANRYSPKQVLIADPAVANLLVTVTYEPAAVQSMLEGLTRALPVQLQTDLPDRLVLRARQ